MREGEKVFSEGGGRMCLVREKGGGCLVREEVFGERGGGGCLVQESGYVW